MKFYLLALVIAFFTSLIFCLLLIPALRKWGAGQNILSYVKEHKSKSGTPTMGGLAFIPASVLVAVTFMKNADRTDILCIAIGLAYMLVGFLDDFLKKKHAQNLGLRAWQKFAFQGCIALLIGVYCYRNSLTRLNLPFTGRQIEIGLWIAPLAFFAFVATVNAVNLTDGLDGLATASCIPYFLALGLLVWLQAGTGNTVTLCFTLVGALLAYLLFNTSPASVFMGDTGSLALGGFACAIAVLTGNVLYIAVLGCAFVWTTVSVIVQVVYFKLTGGKRVFLMSPFHHHLQQKGYSESKITYAYFIVTLLASTVAILSIL